MAINVRGPVIMGVRQTKFQTEEAKKTMSTIGDGMLPSIDGKPLIRPKSKSSIHKPF